MSLGHTYFYPRSPYLFSHLSKWLHVNHLYLIADGCAEDIISVSLLSNAFKSSQATCSNDILQLVNRFYNVAEQRTGNIYYLILFLKPVKLFFFVCFLFSCIWFGIPENHQNNLIQAVSITTLLLLNRIMLDLSDESIQTPGINENHIYNFHSEVQTFSSYI